MKNSGIEGPSAADASEQDISKLLTPKQAAEIIVSGIENDRYRVLAGKDSKLMDKLYRLSPKRAVGLIAKNMKNLIEVK